jgi:hypothetical protein
LQKLKEEILEELKWGSFASFRLFAPPWQRWFFYKKNHLLGWFINLEVELVISIIKFFIVVVGILTIKRQLI